MATTSRTNVVHMGAAADEYGARCIIQSILALPTDTAWVCEIEDGDDFTVARLEGATKTSESVIFPAGLAANGLKFKTATNCSVFIYLQ